MGRKMKKLMMTLRKYIDIIFRDGGCISMFGENVYIFGYPWYFIMKKVWCVK